MIGPSMAGTAGPHFAARSEGVGRWYLEVFPVFLGLQNLTGVTSYMSLGYAKDRKWISNFILANHTPILDGSPLFGITPTGVVLIQMKSPNKYTFSSKPRCDHWTISRRSLELSVGEVIVLMCTSNSQSMSSKLQLEVSEHEIRFLFMPTRSKTNVNSLYLALGFMKNIFLP